MLLTNARLRGNDTLKDFVVKCGASEWKVHGAVLSLHSSVLARACGGNFKVSDCLTMTLNQSRLN